MSGKLEIPWTFDARDIPHGWVRLASLGGGGGGRKQSRKYNIVHGAIGRGEITGEEVIKIKMTPADPRGPIYVDPKAIERVVSQAALAHEAALNARRTTAKDVAGDRHAESVCESLADIATTLAEIRSLLERVALAGESIATQPKSCDAAENGTWRDMNGECH